MGPILVQISTTDTDPSYCKCQITGACYSTHSFLLPSVTMLEGGAKYTVKFADLKQPSFGTPVHFDPTQILSIMFASDGPQDFDFWIDEVSLVK
jgi:hypothetical protein